MAQWGTDVAEDLQLLDVKIKQLRNEYEQYFMGSRKREPHQLRQEVSRMVTYYTNVPIQNTGYRFKFNNLRARLFSLRRHWDMTLRKIEEGRYERHLFQAKLRERERRENTAAERPRRGGERDGADGPDLFERYVAARETCGQESAGLTREKLDGILRAQEAAIRSRTGCADVRFRVVVENGKAKLKATPVRR